MTERKTLTLSLGDKAKTRLNQKTTGVQVEVKRKRNSNTSDLSKTDEKTKKLQELLKNASLKEKEDAAKKAKFEQVNKKKAELEAKEKEIALKEEQERLKKSKKFETTTPVVDEPIKPSFVINKKERKYDDDDVVEKKKKKSKKPLNTFTKGNKINITKLSLDEDAEEKIIAPNVGLKKLRSKNISKQKPKLKVLKTINVSEAITVKELAEKMSEKAADVVKILMKMGTMATINQAIDQDTAELVATELGHTVNRISENDIEMSVLKDETENKVHIKKRPPVVTIMGHVDHGKTSLLDVLRKANVVDGEAGGITQHIGAYQIESKNGEKITFIDTPGHAAFSAMRARGANITDIIVLVVAANDSVKPQTIEAISHAKSAGVPVILAINKIDLHDANPQKVRMDLLQHEFVVESLGGEILEVEVSAKQKLNLDKLEEAILLQAEMMELKGNYDGQVEGSVIEAQVQKGLGSTATVLINKGTLNKGDIFISGKSWGKVRNMINENGKMLKKATPSQPVAITGFDTAPTPGDDFVVVDSEAKARKVVSFRIDKAKKEAEAARSKNLLENMFANADNKDKIVLPIIIKADVQGSIEAIKGMIEKVGNEKASANVIHSSVGGINKTDISLAKSSGALIIAFNTRATAEAREEAKNSNIEIRYHSIIYNVLDEVKDILTGKLTPEYKENFIGYADVIQTFKINKITIAGCKTTEGVIKRSSKCRIIRDDIVVYEGDIGMLKREKNEVKEVQVGTEFGMSFANHNDILIGDKIECFEVEEIKAKLD